MTDTSSPRVEESDSFFTALVLGLRRARAVKGDDQERMIATLLAVRDFAKGLAADRELREDFDFLRGQMAKLSAAMAELADGIDSPLFLKAASRNKRAPADNIEQVAIAAAILDVASKRGFDQSAVASMIAEALSATGLVVEGARAPGLPTAAIVKEWRNKCRRSKTRGGLPARFNARVQQLDGPGFPGSEKDLRAAVERIFSS